MNFSAERAFFWDFLVESANDAGNPRRMTKPARGQARAQSNSPPPSPTSQIAPAASKPVQSYSAGSDLTQHLNMACRQMRTYAPRMHQYLLVAADHCEENMKDTDAEILRSAAGTMEEVEARIASHEANGPEYPDQGTLLATLRPLMDVKSSLASGSATRLAAVAVYTGVTTVLRREIAVCARWEAEKVKQFGLLECNKICSRISQGCESGNKRDIHGGMIRLDYYVRTGGHADQPHIRLDAQQGAREWLWQSLNSLVQLCENYWMLAQGGNNTMHTTMW